MTVIHRAAGLLSCVLLAACHATPDAGPPPAGPPDQSNVFFPKDIDTYGLDLPPIDREHLVELQALRRIDPCGLVDGKVLATDGRPDASYIYSAAHDVSSNGMPLIATLERGAGCTIAFPSSSTALVLRVLAGEPRANDYQFTPTPAHPEVSARTSPLCSFRVSLPLARMANAPAAMRDPLIEVSPLSLANGELEAKDTSLCALGETIAQEVVNHVRSQGVPAHPSDTIATTKLLTADPCAAVRDLHAVGFEWHDPAPEAQYATTWRNPSVCDIRLRQPTDGTPAPFAIVKYGLAYWSDDVVPTSVTGEVPTRTQRDGIGLFVYRNDCYAVAKANATIAPATVGAGAPNLAAPTPVVTVRLPDPEVGDCNGVAADTAVAALKRAT